MAVTTGSVAGILAGRNPLEYESSNPITLFLFQAVFIIALCQIIHIPLGYMRQPRVIAEVITGIVLGPTAMGHIPGFTDTCFPTASIPNLTLVANVGIIFFLFLVGLEVDIKFIKKNLRIALTVGLTNMAIPFGFGCIIAIGLHENYGQGLKFTTYMVFIAVAMCITAFPVLARILTELRLLKDRVGTIVLAAGITNDVIGWILLALSVTLANAGSGITTLYILLVVFGWALFVLYPVRIVLNRYILKNDLRKGELSRFGILSIFILVFISSFFTDIIGIHSIFGAFLVGLIVPREHGFIIDITNKIEDLVHIILIPIYFALAGFKVNLGQLNTGKDWGYTIALIVIAVITKVFGGFVAAKLNGLLWRESLSVGVLMSCKGIVEIVVLSVGYNAGIITSQVFSMFVVMTLVSTFLTTPLTMLSYPVSYREKVQRYMKGEIDWDGNIIERSVTKSSDATNFEIDKFNENFKFDEVIYNIEDVSGFITLLNFVELFYGYDKLKEPGYKSKFHAIFLKQFSERTTDLIEASTNIDDSNDYKYHVQLELLKKFFHFNEVPYVGDLKYYVGEDKLISYLETSSNENDLMIFAINKEDLDLELIDNSLKSRNEIIPEFAILFKSTELKINSISFQFSTHMSSNNLIIYLVSLFINNNPNLNSIQILLEEPSDEIEKLIERLQIKIKTTITKITKFEEITGLFITRYESNTLKEFVDKSHESQQTFDILAVK